MPRIVHYSKCKEGRMKKRISTPLVSQPVDTKNGENSKISVLLILAKRVGFSPIYYMKHYIETLCSD